MVWTFSFALMRRLRVPRKNHMKAMLSSTFPQAFHMAPMPQSQPTLPAFTMQTPEI